MPIKGFTERARLSRGGHLRLGTKVDNQGGKGSHPVKSDYFIADFDDPAHAELFHKMYGQQPREVEICFHSNDPEVIFPQWYCCYGSSSGLKCKGDGETAMRLNAPGDLAEVDCLTPEHCDFAKQNGCKQQGMLQFFIKGLPTMKVFQINTTSWNSMLNVNSAIKMLQWLRRGHSIAGVWVRLKLVKRETTSKSKGGKVTIYVLEIDLPPNVTIEGGAKLLSFVDGAPTEAPASSDIGNIEPDSSKDDLLHGDNEQDDGEVSAAEVVDATTLDDRAAVITEVANLLNAIPDNARRIQAVASARDKSGSKTTRWSEWETSAIKILRDSITPKSTSEDDERKLLIGRVNGLLLDLPAKEIRDEIVRAARIETSSKGNDWEKWDTESIQRLHDALIEKAA